MNLLPLYLRREPTTDPVLRSHIAATPGAVPTAAHRDVVAYRDEACTQPAARWNWFMHKPTRAYKTVTFNCYRWRAVWRPDLPATGPIPGAGPAPAAPGSSPIAGFSSPIAGSSSSIAGEVRT